MTMPEEGEKAPDLALPDQDGMPRKLSEFRGKWVLVYFYPKDDTPGCTREACALRDRHREILAEGAVVLGVSIDPAKSHAKFAKKYDLPFPLLADEKREAVMAWGVWGRKRFMGREYDGTHRVSFLIDPKGRIAKVYPKVKPETHADEVLADLRKAG